MPLTASCLGRTSNILSPVVCAGEMEKERAGGEGVEKHRKSDQEYKTKQQSQVVIRHDSTRWQQRMIWLVGCFAIVPVACGCL